MARDLFIIPQQGLKNNQSEELLAANLVKK